MPDNLQKLNIRLKVHDIYFWYGRLPEQIEFFGIRFQCSTTANRKIQPRGWITFASLQHYDYGSGGAIRALIAHAWPKLAHQLSLSFGTDELLIYSGATPEHEDLCESLGFCTTCDSFCQFQHLPALISI